MSAVPRFRSPAALLLVLLLAAPVGAEEPSTKATRATKTPVGTKRPAAAAKSRAVAGVAATEAATAESSATSGPAARPSAPNTRRGAPLVPPPAPGDPLASEEAAAPIDPEEAEEWFGDLDSETLEMAAPDPDFERPMPPGPDEWDLVTSLELTDEQRGKLRSIRERQRDAQVRSESELRIEGIGLQELLEAESPDRAAIDAQIDRIAQQRAAQRKARVGAMLEARQILTAGQRAELKTERDRWRKAMLRHARPASPPRPAGVDESQ